jgi:hypothetical protein
VARFAEKSANDGFDDKVPWKMVPLKGRGVIKLIGGANHRLSLVDDTGSTSLDASVRSDHKSADGSRVMDLQGDGVGKAVLLAKDPASAGPLPTDARLEIDVLQEISMTVKFYGLSDMGGHTFKRPPSEANQLLLEANLIHGPQDNVGFLVQPPFMPVTVPTDLGKVAVAADALAAVNGLFRANTLRRCDASLHVFFIWAVEKEAENARANRQSTLAITFASQNVVLLEDGKVEPGITLAHELGHFLLGDSAPNDGHDLVDPANLMFKSANGGKKLRKDQCLLMNGRATSGSTVNVACQLPVPDLR